MFDEFSVEVRRWLKLFGDRESKAMTGIPVDTKPLLDDLESKAVTELSVDTELLLGVGKSLK